MSRVHGCTRATLGTLFFGQAKKSFVHGRTYAAIAWMRKNSASPLEGETILKKE
jgi:hypothetical protein